MDFGRSDHAGVQAQLNRLGALTVPQGRLGLDTVRTMMERLGNPHRQLPPVFHVAGTNGKGSTCAFLRAMLEADGKRVHVTTSPHLVRYNERIRLAGKLIEDEALAALLEEVLDACEDLAPSFFEVTIAAAFLAFSRTPADACVVEVGLGGRFDATNVLEPEVLAACGIAALGLDHEHFLLAPETGAPTEPMARIAFEKAGIAKTGVPLVTQTPLHLPTSRTAIADVAAKVRAPLIHCAAELPNISPALAGEHQARNAQLAIDMLRAQTGIEMSAQAIAIGQATARWPARLHRLSQGPLIGQREVWLDGGHNRNAGEALARHFNGQRLHLIIGMLGNKHPSALLVPMASSIASVTVVPVPEHDHHPVTAFGEEARWQADIPSALGAITSDDLPVLIAGSLYLAGEVLRLNNEIPD